MTSERRLIEALADIARRLERIEEAIALPWAVAVRGPRPRLPLGDRERLAALLPRVHAVVGDGAFRLSDVVKDAAIRAASSGLSEKQVGKLFARGAVASAEALILGDWRIESLGRKSGAQTWRVTSLQSALLSALKAPDVAC